MEILLINIVLSGDNAVVIAMASKNLPVQQRKWAVWWGTAGAVFLRLLLTAAAVFLLELPYIRALGSLLLLYIAIKLLVDNKRVATIRRTSSLVAAVWTIIAADLIMSLDNVLAIAALAMDNILMLAAGIGMSIPIIIWGSKLIMRLLLNYPALIYLGAAILGFTAGQMLMDDPRAGAWIAKLPLSLYGALPIGCMLFVIIAGWMSNRRKVSP